MQGVAEGSADPKHATAFKNVVQLLRDRARRARNIFHSGEHRQTGKATSGVC